MESCANRTPILERSKKVYGYSIETSGNVAVDTLDTLISKMHSNKMDDKPVMIPLSNDLITNNIPELFNPEKVIIEVNASDLKNMGIKDCISKMVDSNYQIALNVDTEESVFNHFNLFSIIKVKISSLMDPSPRLDGIVNTAKRLNKKICITDINSNSEYGAAEKLNPDFYEGTAVASSVTCTCINQTYLSANVLQILVELQKEEPNTDKLEKIALRDASLSASLLRIANSAYFCPIGKVLSVKQAIVAVGLQKLKYIVYMLNTRPANTEDAYEEVIKNSFLRAMFSQEISSLAKHCSINQYNAYLVGLFSTLDILSNKPMEVVLESIEIDECIKEAIIYKEGQGGDILKLITAYEEANWQKVDRYCSNLKIKKNKLGEMYYRCIEYVNTIWGELKNAIV